ncbi:emp24p/erv25p- protein [Kappamyces sp. JEL0680]|nr:emp24p/erv25p- protein [Kappamyces sp. JEL0680]
MAALRSLLCFLLPALVFGFHFYVDANEQKCFREELSVNTGIVGAYKALIFDSNVNTFVEDRSAQMKVLVRMETSSDHLVDSAGSTRGKFHFTAAENGVHLICLYGCRR